MARASFALVKPLRAPAAYLQSSVAELRKVVWPSRELTIQYTLIVIVSVVVVTALTAALDYGLSNLLTKLISWSQR